jgi:hypothetical protein
VQRIDARLGARESEPGERVEEIVQIVRARLDAAGLVDPDLVVRVFRSGRHEAHRFAALGSYFPLLCKRVQSVQGSIRVEPRPNPVKNRMR